MPAGTTYKQLLIVQRLLCVVLIATVIGTHSAEAVYSTASLGNPDGDMTGSARAIAMGSAFVAVAEDSTAALWNQAGLADLTRPEVSVHHNTWLVDVNKETFILGMPLRGIGGVGVVGHYIGYGTFKGKDEKGASTGSYEANQMCLGTGIGVRVLRNISMGVALRGTQQTLAWKSTAFWDADAGLLLRAGPDWRVGIAYSNMALSHRNNSSETVLRVGTSFQALKLRDYLLRLAFSGSIKPQARNRIQFGVENEILSRFFVRAGYMLELQDTLLDGLRGFAAGAGMKMDHLSLDYAFLPFGNLGNSHRVSLSYQFGKDVSTAPSTQVSPVVTPAIPVTVIQQQAIVPAPANPITVQIPTNSTALGQVIPKPLATDGGSANKALKLEFELSGDAMETGKSLEEQGKLREAARVYQQAIQDDPNNSKAWWAMGQLYYRQGQKQYAIRCIEQVIRLNPGEKKLVEWLEKYKATRP